MLHLTTEVERSPLLITQQQDLLTSQTIEAKEVFGLILDRLL